MYSLKTVHPVQFICLMQDVAKIPLPVQGTWVRSPVWKDVTFCGTTKPMCHNYSAFALEPGSCSYEAHTPRARAPQQEKPP